MAATSVKPAPYKDFLQPALHRRFMSSLGIVLAISYVDAVLLSSWDSLFWSWFPLGATGLRTFAILASAFLIIILRISQYHVGRRTSSSPIQTLKQSLVKPAFYETIVTYLVSSVLFAFVYLWSAPASAGLRFINYHVGDRARLNERPLLLISYFVTLGLAQGILHTLFDEDRILLGRVKVRNGDQRPYDAIQALAVALRSAAMSSFQRTVGVLVLHPILYQLLFRPIGWSWAMWFFRPFYNLPKSNVMPSAWPHSIPLFIKLGWASFLVMFLWSSGNAAFSVFMVKEPLKNLRPLSSDSKNRNGSLLNGLRSKKFNIQCYAMWELALIAFQFDDRRKELFEDIDGKDGPVWPQAYGICIRVVRSIEERIGNYGKQPAPLKTEESDEPKKRVTQPLTNDPEHVFQKRSLRTGLVEELKTKGDKLVRSPGETPLSQLSPVGKKYATLARDKVLTKEQQDAITPSALTTLSRAAVKEFMGWPIGAPFRQSFERRLNKAVFGEPYGEISLYLNAVTALSKLAVHSLVEDKYGHVQRDVAAMIRTFTSVITKLDQFKEHFPEHWMDISREKKSDDVDALLEALREGLSQVIEAFGPYSRDLGLSRLDMRKAAEAAQGPLAEPATTDERTPEMEQVR